MNKKFDFKTIVKIFGAIFLIAIFSKIMGGRKSKESAIETQKTAQEKINWSKIPSDIKYKKILSTLNEPTYKGVVWTSNFNEVIKVHKPENQMKCGFELCKSMTPADRQSPFCRIIHDLKDLKSNPYIKDFDFSFTKLFEYADVELKGLDDRFKVVRTGNGCGFYFNDMYLAQINWVDKGLSKDEVLTDLKQSWRLIGNKQFNGSIKYSLESGDRDVYKFQSVEGDLIIAFYSNNVVSMYYHPEIHRLIFEDIDGQGMLNQIENQEKTKTEKTKNTEKYKKDL